jgi:hypothetical protein
LHFCAVAEALTPGVCLRSSVAVIIIAVDWIGNNYPLQLAPVISGLIQPGISLARSAFGQLNPFIEKYSEILNSKYLLPFCHSPHSLRLRQELRKWLLNSTRGVDLQINKRVFALLTILLV